MSKENGRISWIGTNSETCFGHSLSRRWRTTLQNRVFTLRSCITFSPAEIWTFIFAQSGGYEVRKSSSRTLRHFSNLLASSGWCQDEGSSEVTWWNKRQSERYHLCYKCTWSCRKSIEQERNEEIPGKKKLLSISWMLAWRIMPYFYSDAKISKSWRESTRRQNVPE